MTMNRREGDHGAQAGSTTGSADPASLTADGSHGAGGPGEGVHAGPPAVREGDCNCPQSLALTAEVERLRSEFEAARSEQLRIVTGLATERDALTARVAEVEAERDAARDEAVRWRLGATYTPEDLLEVLGRTTTERDALQAAIAETDANADAVAKVLAACHHRLQSFYGQANAVLAHLRSRAAVTPGSGGGLGGGG